MRVWKIDFRAVYCWGPSKHRSTDELIITNPAKCINVKATSIMKYTNYTLSNGKVKIKDTSPVFGPIRRKQIDINVEMLVFLYAFI